MALSCGYWNVTFLQNFCHAIKFLHFLSEIGNVTNIFAFSKKIVMNPLIEPHSQSSN